MKKSVEFGMPKSAVPFEWAVVADRVLYTVQGPFLPDGSIETGPPERQAEVTLSNLRRCLQAAGGDLSHVTQVLIYITEPSAFPSINAVYQRYFEKPYPNRATFVTGLMIPGAVIEIIAYAHLPVPSEG